MNHMIRRITSYVLYLIAVYFIGWGVLSFSWQLLRKTVGEFREDSKIGHIIEIITGQYWSGPIVRTRSITDERWVILQDNEDSIIRPDMALDNTHFSKFFAYDRGRAKRYVIFSENGTPKIGTLKREFYDRDIKCQNTSEIRNFCEEDTIERLTEKEVSFIKCWSPDMAECLEYDTNIDLKTYTWHMVLLGSVSDDWNLTHLTLVIDRHSSSDNYEAFDLNDENNANIFKKHDINISYPPKLFFYELYYEYSEECFGFLIKAFCYVVGVLMMINFIFWGFLSLFINKKFYEGGRWFWWPILTPTVLIISIVVFPLVIFEKNSGYFDA